MFAGKLAETQPAYDNDGRLHAPPIHPGMPAPTLSGPREDPEAGMPPTETEAKQAAASHGLFGNLFNSKTVTASSTPSSQVADGTTDANANDHSSFFVNLFNPKSDQPPAPQVQGAVLAGLNPNPPSHKAETPRSEPQQSEPQVAQTPKPKIRSQQDAGASSVDGNGLLKGAQPVVPAGNFASRWAGTPPASGQ